MDKPQYLSMKDWLVRKIAPKLLKSERVVDAVISHQFTSAAKAFHKHNSVELTGFGKFLFNPSKARKKIIELEKKIGQVEEKLKSPSLTPAREEMFNNMLRIARMQIEEIQQKLTNNEPKSDLRGVEEQSDSPSPFEGADSECERSAHEYL